MECCQRQAWRRPEEALSSSHPMTPFAPLLLQEKMGEGRKGTHFVMRRQMFLLLEQRVQLQGGGSGADWLFCHLHFLFQCSRRLLSSPPTQRGPTLLSHRLQRPLKGEGSIPSVDCSVGLLGTMRGIGCELSGEGTVPPEAPLWGVRKAHSCASVFQAPQARKSASLFVYFGLYTI